MVTKDEIIQNLGYAIIRLGWRIYMSGEKYKGNCVGYEIHENGVKYSIERRCTE